MQTTNYNGAIGEQRGQGEQQARLSYRVAIRRYRQFSRLRRFNWVTWLILLVTVAVWCVTAYQVALAAGAQNLRDVLANVLSDAENADVLVAYGAKYNSAILAGQYWRFVTPIFLHANILHIGLNMLNFVVLGIVIERIFGHLRFLMIYLVTGVISIIASALFMPDEVSVGASGAIFGIVGAYAVFVLVHRRAFPRRGIPTLLWLVIVIGINLAIGLFISNVDNYAHLGGFASGCILGFLFTPRYIMVTENNNVQGAMMNMQGIEDRQDMKDIHSLARRWPLALCVLAATLLLAAASLHFMGG